jgi:four helix bundle protein
MAQSAADALQERLVLFAVKIIDLVTHLPKSIAARHVAGQVPRSKTSPAPNYAEARAAESRADFIHKLRIAVKELNETGIWLLIILKARLAPDGPAAASSRRIVSLLVFSAPPSGLHGPKVHNEQMTNDH